MLTISLREGEYFTLNNNMVVKVTRAAGRRCTLSVEAPREVPITRGSLLEREGERPACLDKTI